MEFGFLLLILLLIVLLVIAAGVKIVSQSKAYVIERLGAYHRTIEMGLHYVVPILDRVATVVSLKEMVKDFAPQPVITKDNVTMQIDTVVYYQITDPKLYTYGVENPISAIENLTATTLRNIIGDLELDETLTSRDVINTKMRSILMKLLMLGELKFIVLKLKIFYLLETFKKQWKNKCVQNVKDVKLFCVLKVRKRVKF